jgi:DNA-binding CsgD family transcriptional regulator
MSFDVFARSCSLTTREKQIAQLATRGLQNPEIAALLGISPFTVRNGLVKVFAKADVSTRAELSFIAGQATEPATSASSQSPTDGLHEFYRRVRGVRGVAGHALLASSAILPVLVTVG